MSIIDKTFLNELLTLPSLSNYDELVKFMDDNDKVQNMFPLANLLINKNLGNGSDTCHYILFIYQDKYIFIEIYEGTCDMCINRHYNMVDTMIRESIDKAYISTDINGMFEYVYKKMNNNDDDGEFHYYFSKWKIQYLFDNNVTMFNDNTFTTFL
jgi:hypothetical protein